MKKDLQQSNENTPIHLQNTKVLTFAEACQYLKVSKSFLYKATSERNIAFCKPTGGKLIYFRRKDLDEWLTQNRFASKNEITNKNEVYNVFSPK